MILKKLPIGIDGFEKLIRNDFYYVDKTGLIVELLHNWGEVNLFTRPRRFGKSLNMSMLKSFFEIGCDKTLFDGLKVSEEQELCEQYMGQFPVISISLKSVDGTTFDEACSKLQFIIGSEAKRFSFLEESSKLSDNEKRLYYSLIREENEAYVMSDAALVASLKTLSWLLAMHFEHKVIILIDDCDTPLENAYRAGYYKEMASLIGNMFGNALKTNNDLKFAVMTGKMMIANESAITGLNNLNVHEITDIGYSECFGFSDRNVQEMLTYYGLLDQYPVVKEWYGGYCFGNTAVYCTQDVVYFCDDACRGAKKSSLNYWMDTNENNIVRRFIDKASATTKSEIEQLVAGEAIIKLLKQNLSYVEIDKSIENFWGGLFAMGYLTLKKRIDRERYELVIPNREIRDLFVKEINEWFKKKTQSEPSELEAFCNAVVSGDESRVEEQLSWYLFQTILLRDEAVHRNKKENFYHGVLLELLSYPNDWLVKSNAEAGDGYSDICIADYERNTGVIIEVKYAEKGVLDTACIEALKQIESRNYEETLYDEGMKQIVKYGIAFYKKQCKVVRG